MSLASEVLADIGSRVSLAPHQKRWIRNICSPRHEVVCISTSRGSAKTWTMAQVAACAMREGSPLFTRGQETLIVSSSYEQSRHLYGYTREFLSDIEHRYRFTDSGQRLGITHRDTRDKTASPQLQWTASHGTIQLRHDPG